MHKNIILMLFVSFLLFVPFVFAVNEPLDIKHGYMLSNTSDINITTNLANQNSTTFTGGIVGNGANFTAGYNQALYNTTAGILSHAELGAFTISFWIYPNATTTDQNIMSGSTGSSGMSFNIIPYPSAGCGSNYLAFAFYDGASRYVCSNFTLAARQWSHVTITRNGNNFIFYLNGTQQNTVSQAIGTTSRCGSSFGIGANVYCSTINPVSAFTGMADEIYVYNRTLNSSQIAILASTNTAQYPFSPQVSTISISSSTPANYTYSLSATPTFSINVNSISGTWNLTLYLNSTAYGTSDSITTSGVYNITASSVPTSKEYLWWVNATHATASTVQTEKRNIYITGTSSNVCAITQKTCTFTAGSIALSAASGCVNS